MRGASSSELTIVTWNVNSIRLRARAIRRLVRRYDPHVLCFQETKVSDPSFPRDLFTRLGYPYAIIHGQKTHHGVAIVSRLPLRDARTRSWCGQRDARHVYARLPGGVELHDFYVPAGGQLADPKRNPKFAHKLRFLSSVTRWLRRRRRESPRGILVGDLNVAPLETDVWDHAKLKRVVTHTPIEVEALAKMRRSQDWVDAVRHFVPARRKLFTWWSYRAEDWKTADKGRRLDHVWVTPSMVPDLLEAKVIKAARGWEPASDHAPVLLTLR